MTAAKRAQKKANRAAKEAKEATDARVESGELEPREEGTHTVTESEHAAAMMALAAARKMKRKKSE
jgi:hypothetical protein